MHIETHQNVRSIYVNAEQDTVQEGNMLTMTTQSNTGTYIHSHVLISMMCL